MTCEQEKLFDMLRDALEELLELTESECPHWQHPEQEEARVALKKTEGM